ncbi:MAG: peptide chain release factor 1 [Alphaproteobacteria bacterium]|nr:peptide chain release factor 1 [Alphaproteobacteria bacterium]HCP01882.1 peptide chain release factor 1 [Rhodospirillaceae bacterium]
MSLDEKLDRVVQRHAQLSDMLAQTDGSDPQEYIRLSKEYSELNQVVEAVLAQRGALDQIGDLEEIIGDGETDAEIKELAEVEIAELRARASELEQALKIMLLPKDEADAKNAILEIRAGTGGDEAALFAANLFRMYQRYAEAKGWKVEVMTSSGTGIGGYKEIVSSISGKDVFSRLKYESGVHRVQRVPETESSGRIHTSASTVAVLPEAEEIDIDIAESDLRIDTYRASGPGGQSVNTTDSAVRITHAPTGIVVTQQDEKSQHKNRAKAMRVLRARIYEHERQQADAERAESRRSQVGSGDRSERIRTYNYPQGRVTDHRINLTLHKLERILDGEGLDELVDALTTEEQAAQLSEDDGTHG